MKLEVLGAALILGLAVASNAGAQTCACPARHRAVYHHVHHVHVYRRYDVHVYYHHDYTMAYPPPPPGPVYYQSSYAPPPAYYARPADARLYISGGSVAFIAGVSWGRGRLDYRGHSYPVKVLGLKVGSIGIASYNAHGDVYNLRYPGDIAGAYGAADASATIGAGAGALTLHNGRGVVINLTSSNAGLQATLAPAGLTIELE